MIDLDGPLRPGDEDAPNLGPLIRKDLREFLLYFVLPVGSYIAWLVVTGG